MISKQGLRSEQDYLKSVLYVLEKEISKKEAGKAQLEEDINRTMRYIWEAGSTEADDYTASEQSVRQLNRGVIERDHSLKAYRRMIASAYFARVDIEQDGETTPVYLGIASLKDGNEFYVFDWRAPICSPFYDSDVGETSYTLPDGTVVNCKVTLKRQYKIENDRIIEIFDTNMQVVDEVLSKILASTGSTKMKNIVATIQKEQNRIIRKQDVDILAVLGPAGSGKTSVALHRIAYLLYADKENLNKNNMLILSPNETFSDYISDVLPQMGEDNVYQTTFYDYVQAFTREFKIKNNMNAVYEELFNEKKTKFYNSIKFKFWPGYIKLIEEEIENKKLKLFGVDKDVELDGQLMASSEFLVRYVQNSLSSSDMTILEQAKLVNEKIMNIASVRLVNNTKGKNKLTKQLNLVLKKISAKNIYAELYGNLEEFIGKVQSIYNELGTVKSERLTIKELKDVFEYTADNLSKGQLSYEDVNPYMYLKERVTGLAEQHYIKQVVIDEAQDYSLVQYKVIEHAFRRAQITLLADVNQSIMPFVNYEDFDGVLSTLQGGRARIKTETQYLTKTYRSTVEINDFASSIISGTNSLVKARLDRHGDEVLITKDDETGARSKLVKDALELKKKYNTVAIIYKTERECREFLKQISRSADSKNFIFMMDGENNFSADRVMVMPVYIAKGLEFDAVLVPSANENNYNAKNRKLFYVAVTRAMNKLNIYYDDVPSSLIIK